MWFKKKSVLQAEHHYNTEKSADGTTDLRTALKYYHNSSSSITTSGRPSAADAGNYFYLPVLGLYNYAFPGQLDSVGSYGAYWSSSASSLVSVYYLGFDSGNVYMVLTNRNFGFRVDGFE